MSPDRTGPPACVGSLLASRSLLGTRASRVRDAFLRSPPGRDRRTAAPAGPPLPLRSLAMISPTDDIDEVLSRGVAWDALHASRLITDADLALVSRFDAAADADAKRSVLDEVRRRANGAASRRSHARYPREHHPAPGPSARTPRGRRLDRISRATIASLRALRAPAIRIAAPPDLARA